MSASAVSSVVDRHAAYNKTRLFVVSLLALFTAGVGASLRSNVAGDLQRIFFDPIDKAHSAEMIGSVLGVPFLGYAFTIAIGSPLLDAIGMGILLPMSGVLFIVGTLIILFAGSFANVYTVMWAGAVVTGIGWGLVETVINPLTTTLYPEDKTARLNTLHAWWPGGLIAGGLFGIGMGALGVGWQVKLAAVMVPAALVVILCMGVKFPPTERVASGYSMGSMFRELLKPMFLLLFCSMFLTAASELAPGQWVDLALTRTVGMRGIWLLVYVSGLMFVMRHFAGTMAHKLSPIGLLWVSCLLASIGLFALSLANSPVTGLLGGDRVGYWGLLHVADHAGDRGGAVSARGRAADRTDGDRGHAFDYLRSSGDGADLRLRRKSPWQAARRRSTLCSPARNWRECSGLPRRLRSARWPILPAVLLIVFGAIWLYDRPTRQSTTGNV